jgi:hypothetical protein
LLFLLATERSTPHQIHDIEILIALKCSDFD